MLSARLTVLEKQEQELIAERGRRSHGEVPIQFEKPVIKTMDEYLSFTMTQELVS